MATGEGKTWLSRFSILGRRGPGFARLKSTRLSCCGMRTFSALLLLTIKVFKKIILPF